MHFAGTATTQVPAVEEWTALQRVTFRMFFVFFMLNVPDYLIYWLPLGPKIYSLYLKPWSVVVPWFGKHVLGLSREITRVTMGDSAGGYVLLLCEVLIALAAAAVWTLVDRHRKEYRTVHYWLRVCVRYGLAFSTLNYGISKLMRRAVSGNGIVRPDDSIRLASASGPAVGIHGIFIDIPGVRGSSGMPGCRAAALASHDTGWISAFDGRLGQRTYDGHQLRSQREADRSVAFRFRRRVGGSRSKTAREFFRAP
jgi:hypothetical protein